MRENLTVALLGNALHSWTTENEYIDAFVAAGHHPFHFQEGELWAATALCEDVRHGTSGFDLVVWIRTPELARKMGTEIQWRLIAECQKASVPLIGVHLDRWWGLEREHMVREDPYFRVDLLCTADGGHDDQWVEAGVNHRWLLPAVSERWCKPGNYDPKLACDVLFVGSWKHYHEAWEHRMEMVQELSRAYGKNFQVAPKYGEPRVVGTDLNDLYWSAKVVVGDSCLVPLADGSPMVNYCSDRVPETLGRGGVLLHPAVEGLPFEFASWRLGDFKQMHREVQRLIALPDDERLETRMRSIEHITSAHTYTHRVGHLIDILEVEGLL